MSKKKNKHDKPLKVDMDFDEMIERISKVPKSQVERNIKNQKKKGNKK